MFFLAKSTIFTIHMLHFEGGEGKEKGHRNENENE
jgi:hypothetical protein